MEKIKKRDRSVNFTREETEKLVALVEKRKNIIENKKSDSVTWHDKVNAWKAIEAEFNSSLSSGIFRHAKHLKLKYEALKRDTRKKVMRAEIYKTGGGTSSAPPLTPIEQKVKDMILLSVEGDESVLDSDQVNNPDFDWPDIPKGPEVKKRKMEVNKPVPSTSQQVNKPVPSSSEQGNEPVPSSLKKWDEWKSAYLESKRHPALCKPKKQPFEKLADEKINVVIIQKQLLEEEREHKRLQKEILEEELLHKRELYKLEKEEMLLKIELLKQDLEKSKQK